MINNQEKFLAMFQGEIAKEVLSQYNSLKEFKISDNNERVLSALSSAEKIFDTSSHTLRSIETFYSSFDPDNPQPFNDYYSFERAKASLNTFYIRAMFSLLTSALPDNNSFQDVIDQLPDNKKNLNFNNEEF